MQKKDTLTADQVKLPLDYKKLENYISSKFIPVFGIKTNLDSDIDEEIAIAYKSSNSANIDIIIFDIFPNEILKKKKEINTQIFYKDNFIFQAHNLFTEDDLGIIIEGKSADNKSVMYFYTFLDDEYKLIQSFSADYSVIIDYEEIESDNGKYNRLNEVTTVDNFFSSTNTSVQQKKVHKWDYKINTFKLVETSQILANKSSQERLFSDAGTYFEFLKGFWYPEYYKEIINRPDILKYNNSNIEFIYFSTNPKEVSVKFDDYINKYSIEKLNILWGQRPGLRLTVKGISESSNIASKIIEVVLLQSDKLQVNGPKKFDESFYVRLPKPFLEYVAEKKELNFKIELDNIIKNINGNFTNDDYQCTLTFDDHQFKINNQVVNENGIYKIIRDDQMGAVIIFLYESSNTIINRTSFIINILKDTNAFSLTPLKYTANGYAVDNVKNLIFYKK